MTGFKLGPRGIWQDGGWGLSTQDVSAMLANKEDTLLAGGGEEHLGQLRNVTLFICCTIEPSSSVEDHGAPEQSEEQTCEGQRVPGTQGPW